jgi:hypothetical protein
LAGSITCAVTAALERGAMVTFGNAFVCCAAHIPELIPQSTISAAVALKQFIIRISLNYLVPRRIDNGSTLDGNCCAGQRGMAGAQSA